MYYIVAIISIIIRQVYLPNPYEAFLDPGTAILFNVIIGSFILHVLSFTITGIYYSKGDAPALGSLSYLIWYSINAAIIIFVGTNFNNIYLALIVLFAIYAIIYSAIIAITNRY